MQADARVVGRAAVMAAHIVGANPIIGVDIKPSRLGVALQLGATHLIDNRHDDVASRIRDIAGGRIDHVVEKPPTAGRCTGLPLRC